MLPTTVKEELEQRIAAGDHPRELAVDMMFALQKHYGYLSDDAVRDTAALLGMSTQEVEAIATFYTFIYREPVGRFVIHVCDSLICWMDGYRPLRDYLSEKLGIAPGETTADGRFTLLPVCCIGYCDRSPAMLINGKAYGPLTTEKIDAILSELSETP